MHLVTPSAGNVRVDIPHERGRRSMALVFQDAKLLPWRRVAANVAFGLEGLGLSHGEIEARVKPRSTSSIFRPRARAGRTSSRAARASASASPARSPSSRTSC